MWKPHTIMPLSRRMRDWDNSHYYAYGYGWRLTDVDGTWKVSHTGTLGGMYSALTLLPRKNAGFVILINGDADDARTVLTQVLVKHFTAPQSRPSVADYADRLQAEQQQAVAAKPVPNTSDRLPVSARELGGKSGVYRDPWFGEVSVCPQQTAVVFASVKSPKMVGDVMRSRGRLLVQWRSPDAEVEPWLDFVATKGSGPMRMRMAKIDPDADFSSDYEDLAFERVGDCPPNP
jgi:hypothetical protein